MVPAVCTVKLNLMITSTLLFYIHTVLFCDKVRRVAATIATHPDDTTGAWVRRLYFCHGCNFHRPAGLKRTAT